MLGPCPLCGGQLCAYTHTSKHKVRQLACTGCRAEGYRTQTGTVAVVRVGNGLRDPRFAARGPDAATEVDRLRTAYREQRKQ